MISGGHTADEAAGTLRRCVRDLVALSALPAVWQGHEPADLARSTAETLLSVLSADLIYVRLRTGLEVAWAEAAVRREHQDHRGVAEIAPEDVRRLREVLLPLLRAPASSRAVATELPSPDRRIHLITMPVGSNAELGQAVVGCYRPDFPNEAEQLLGNVAVNQAAVALQRAGLERSLRDANQTLQSRAERESLVSRIALDLRGTRDPEEIRAAAVRMLGEALEADRCYVASTDGDDGFWISADYCRDGLASLAGRYPFDGVGLSSGTARLSDKTVIVDDAGSWPLSEPLKALCRRLSVRSALAVPLLESGRLVATLTVAMCGETRRWEPEEIALAEAVASLARSSIETARASQREHLIATQLQAALQPPLPELTPGLSLAGHYRAALDEAEVGGDFFDVFAADADTTYLVVGDVSGKGLSAASQVSTVRNMLRFALGNRPGLGQAIDALNRTLAQQTLLSGFATLFVGRYDRRSRSLTYVSCGQEPALVRRAADGAIAELRPTGPVLGSFEHASYTERAVTLLPGDAVAIFTDGLTEAGPTRADLLGIEGVTELLRQNDRGGNAVTLAAALTAGVERFARGGARDDQCLLVAVVDADVD